MNTPPSSPPHPSWGNLVIKTIGPLSKQLSKNHTSKDDDTLTIRLREIGVSDLAIAKILELAADARKLHHDRKEDYRSDKIYAGGLGALNLVIFQTLGSVGAPDLAAHISWIAFVIALPCTAGFLYMSILLDKMREEENYNYSHVHKGLARLALPAGVIAAIALVWHYWTIAGFVLLLTSVPIYVACTLFNLFNRPNFFTLLGNLLTIIQDEQKSRTEHVN